MNNVKLEIMNFLRSYNLTVLRSYNLTVLRSYGLALLIVLLITSCKKDDENPYLEIWKQQNEKAFNDLAFNPDYTELRMSGGYATSIYYRVIQKGEGKRIYYNSRAEVYYKGWFVVTNADMNKTAGTVFDQRLFDDGVTFRLAISAQASDNNIYKQVITGWSIALQYMVEGDKWEIWIPYRLAYYDEKNLPAGMPGFSTLAFEIELIKAIDLDEYNLSTGSSSPYYYY